MAPAITRFDTGFAGFRAADLTGLTFEINDLCAGEALAEALPVVLEPALELCFVLAAIGRLTQILQNGQLIRCLLESQADRGQPLAVGS